MPEEIRLVKPSKARVALALLVKPTYWPDMWRRTKLNVGKALLPAPMGTDRASSEAWCKGVAVTEEEMAARLDLRLDASFQEKHPDLLKSAEEAERKSAESLGGGGSVDLIFKICEALEAKKVVETGVAYGWSSLAILASISQRDGHLWSVDMPHPLLKDQGITGVVVPDTLRKHWTLLREPDFTGLKKVLQDSDSFDFIHYDSDKSYEGRAHSYRRLWPVLRDGGLLMSDDIGDNTAFRDFAAEVGQDPVVLDAPGSGQSGKRFVGMLRKGR